MKTKWETIKLSPPPDYDIENAMFDKAEKYYGLVVFASNDSKYSIELLPIVQLAAECYLKNIIENLYEKPISRVLESNHKPEKFTHNLEYLYKMIYPACNRNMPLPKFDYDFSDSLKGIFLDFQATRFPLDADNPSESYKRREVTDNAAQYDAEILKQTKNLTIECRQVLFEIKKSQQELKDKS